MASLLKNLLKKFKLNESTISMVLGILVVFVVGTLVINYFRNIKKVRVEEKKEAVVEETTGIKLEELPTVYTVKEGDNLWKIAENVFGSGYNWVDIANENKLANPNVLAVNQQLTIPKVEVRKPELEVTKTSFGEAITGENYTVAKGDHLWGIAVRAYGDGYQWVKIASENKLVDSDLIHPGNVLKLPR